MSFGIGLGAFVDGFQKGVGLRQQMDENKRRTRDDERRSKLLDEAEAEKNALKGIETEAQAQFSSEVEAGTAKPDSYDEFWTKYALPKRKAELLRQGKVDEARQLTEWGESDAARQGGRLFASAMLKAQTGDAGGALADVIQAGQVKGYIEHGYELIGQDPIVDADGNQVGFRLRVKTAEGKELQQDIAAGDIPRMISTFANPDAAWQSQVEAKNAEKKRAQELEDYEGKKKIDQRYPATPKATDNAEAYRKAREDRLENDLNFADLSQEEQDKAVRADLNAANEYARSQGGGDPAAAQTAPGLSGPEEAPPAAEQPGLGQSPAQPGPAAAAPRKKVVVDETTGQLVPIQPSAERTSPTATAPAAPQPASRPTSQISSPPLASRKMLIEEAADYMTTGGNPEAIALRLMNAGVPESQWPEQLRQASRHKQMVGQAPGLGQ